MLVRTISELSKKKIEQNPNNREYIQKEEKKHTKGCKFKSEHITL